MGFSGLQKLPQNVSFCDIAGFMQPLILSVSQKTAFWKVISKLTNTWRIPQEREKLRVSYSVGSSHKFLKVVHEDILTEL